MPAGPRYGFDSTVSSSSNGAKSSSFDRGLDHRLDAVVARDEGRIDRAHRGAAARRPICGSSREPLRASAPPSRRRRSGSANSCRTLRRPSGSRAASLRRRKVRVKSAWFLRHRVEQILHQRLVAVARREQAELAAQAGLIGRRELLGEVAERCLRLRDRLVLVVGRTAAAGIRRAASGSTARSAAGWRRRSGPARRSS